MGTSGFRYGEGLHFFYLRKADEQWVTTSHKNKSRKRWVRREVVKRRTARGKFLTKNMIQDQCGKFQHFMTFIADAILYLIFSICFFIFFLFFQSAHKAINILWHMWPYDICFCIFLFCNSIISLLWQIISGCWEKSNITTLKPWQREITHILQMFLLFQMLTQSQCCHYMIWELSISLWGRAKCLLLMSFLEKCLSKHSFSTEEIQRQADG